MTSDSFNSIPAAETIGGAPFAVPERRVGSERTRCFHEATIFFNEGASRIECVVKNLSSTGAKVAVSEHLYLPSNFELLIPAKGQTFRVERRWREGEAVGVEFRDGEAPSTRDAKLDAFEAENRNLRLAVAYLADRLAEFERVDLGALKVQITWPAPRS